MLWSMLGQPALAVVGATAVLLVLVLGPAAVVHAARDRRRAARLRAGTWEDQLRAELAHLPGRRADELLDGYRDACSIAALMHALRGRADQDVRRIRGTAADGTETTITLPVLTGGGGDER